MRWRGGSPLAESPAFVLFYRLPATAGRRGRTRRSRIPAGDAAIRHHAGRFGVDPSGVCAMGFSAGGHVCADLLARFAAPSTPRSTPPTVSAARPASPRRSIRSCR